LFDRLGHDWLVVTAVALPDEADDPELDEVDVDGVVVAEAVVDEVAGADVFDVVVVVVVLLASAGSCPVASWMKIPPVQATNNPVASATTRWRIMRTRRRRACSWVEG
jgi:hypothetical protein